MNKLFGIEYIFDEKLAIKEKKISDKLFRNKMNKKKQYKLNRDIMFFLFIFVLILFSFMLIQSFVLSSLNIGLKICLILFIIAICIPLSLLLYFNKKYKELSTLKKEDFYKSAEKFFLFRDTGKVITDAKISIEDDIATLDISYYDNDITPSFDSLKTLHISDFFVVKANNILKPILDINEGIYYIPIAQI